MRSGLAVLSSLRRSGLAVLKGLPVLSSLRRSGLAVLKGLPVLSSHLNFIAIQI